MPFFQSFQFGLTPGYAVDGIFGRSAAIYPSTFIWFLYHIHPDDVKLCSFTLVQKTLSGKHLKKIAQICGIGRIAQQRSYAKYLLDGK